MKALILYRSHYGNTKQVADVLEKELAAQGIESVAQDVRRKLPGLGGFDFFLIGSPTRFAKANRKVRGVLKKIKKKGLTEKPVAVFDTYGPVPTDPEKLEKNQKWLYPGAAGTLQTLAEGQGLKVYSKSLRCEVKDMKGPLADDELEKAASFVKEFISEMQI